MVGIGNHHPIGKGLLKSAVTGTNRLRIDREVNQCLDLDVAAMRGGNQ